MTNFTPHVDEPRRVRPPVAAPWPFEMPSGSLVIVGSYRRGVADDTTHDSPHDPPHDEPDTTDEPSTDTAEPSTDTAAQAEPAADTIDLDAIESDLNAVERALARLADGTYWVDEVTGEPIPDEVLAAQPTARRADGAR